MPSYGQLAGGPVLQLRAARGWEGGVEDSGQLCTRAGRRRGGGKGTDSSSPCVWSDKTVGSATPAASSAVRGSGAAQFGRTARRMPPDPRRTVASALAARAARDGIVSVILVGAVVVSGGGGACCAGEGCEEEPAEDEAYSGTRSAAVGWATRVVSLRTGGLTDDVPSPAAAAASAAVDGPVVDVGGVGSCPLAVERERVVRR